MSNALKNAYINIILPYEEYLAKQNNTSINGTTSPTGKGVKREASTDSRPEGPDSPTSKPAVVPETRKSKRLKKEPVSYAGNLT